MDARTKQNLIDAGCSDEFVENFAHASSDTERLCQLKRYRTGLLGRLHDEQHKLDCLDYLIYQMKQQQQ